ncbi:MAG: hypothetical protein WEC80_00920 [Patescibacteria group bacterium]
MRNIEGEASRARFSGVENKNPKIGRKIAYFASAAVALLGLNQLKLAATSSEYSDFYEQNPQVRWAEGIEGDFESEIERIISENDSEALP